MAIDVAAPANHKNDTKNYSDTYVKRFWPLIPYTMDGSRTREIKCDDFVFFSLILQWKHKMWQIGQNRKNATKTNEQQLRLKIDITLICFKMTLNQIFILNTNTSNKSQIKCDYLLFWSLHIQ